MKMGAWRHPLGKGKEGRIGQVAWQPSRGLELKEVTKGMARLGEDMVRIEARPYDRKTKRMLNVASSYLGDRYLGSRTGAFGQTIRLQVMGTKLLLFLRTVVMASCDLAPEDC